MNIFAALHVAGKLLYQDQSEKITPDNCQRNPKVIQDLQCTFEIHVLYIQVTSADKKRTQPYLIFGTDQVWR